MTIPPVIPPSTPTTPTTPTDITENPTAPVGLIKADGQSTYSADIASGKAMTIMEFGLAIAVPKDQANQVSFATQQYNANSRNDFYQAVISSTLSLIEVYNALAEVAQTYANAYGTNVGSLNTLNNSINNYNSGTATAQNAVNTLNQAINDYNAGNITQTQLNVAIAAYNNFANSRNQAAASVNNSIGNFNTNIQNPNADIAEANAELSQITATATFTGQANYTSSASGMPGYPTVTGDPPVANVTFSPSNIPTAVNTMSPKNGSESSIANAIFGPLFNVFSNQINLTATILQMQSSYQGYIQFILQGQLPFIPPAFYRMIPQLLLSSGGSGIGTGSGVALASIIATLSNPLLSGIIAQGIFSANMTLQQLNINPFTVAKLRFFTQRLMGQLGFLAGARAVNLLGRGLNGLDPQSRAAAIVTALALTSEISFAISSGIISQGIRGILSQAYPFISANSLAALTLQLASATELFMLQAGVFQLSQTLGNPYLLAQLLNTIPSALALGILNPFSPRLTVNPERLAALQFALAANIITQSNISQIVARDIIARSINQINVNAYFNGQVDQQTLVNTFVQNGLNLQAAISLANYSQAYSQAEILGQLILNSSLSRNILSREILASELINGIIQGNPNITGRQLRDQLANQFILNGATPSQAVLAATTALLGNTAGFIPLTLDILTANTLSAAIHRLSGVSNAEVLANELVSTVLGQNLPGSQTSVRAQLDERINLLLKLNDQTVTDAVKANIQAFLAPTLELYAFADRLRDPANAYVFCAQTGIMYGQTAVPSNSANQFKNEVQFLG